MEMLRMSAEDHARLQFDANDYRALRIEELRLSALTAAEKVKRSRMPFEFSPMNSRERRIIHLALRGEPDVRSESAGFGSHRQVVIYPADMPSKPAGSSAPPSAPRTPLIHIVESFRYDRCHLDAGGQGRHRCGPALGFGIAPHLQNDPSFLRRPRAAYGDARRTGR